jgi:predicted phage tail protein
MENLDIYGEKGGGGHTPVEADDTLKSTQTMRLLFALSEGEIDSVTNILANSIDISNYSPKIVTWESRTGTIDQEVIKGFSSVEAPLSGGNTFPFELRAGVNKEYSFLGQYDAARITLMVNSLQQVTNTGDRLGYEVSLQLWRLRVPATNSPNAIQETWQPILTTTKNGKTTNAYTWDIRVEKPEGTSYEDSWKIRIARTSPDDTSDRFMSKTFVANVITITEAKNGVVYNYPKTALVGMTIYDAKNFGTTIPEMKFKVKGLKFLLPTNYNPTTRTYSETSPWTGSFKSYTEYTDNLAWVTYWVLRNDDWGLGISAADIDLGSFYLYAKHCDELVQTGIVSEPRYTIHLQCVERENVPTFLMKLLTLGNSNFSSNEFGQIKIVWDGAGQAITKVVSNATVIDGMFDYTSNDLEGRTNLVNVTYAREDFFGDSDTVTHYEDSLIARYGLQTSDVILLGCKSEYQALRKARWALYNNCYSGDVITFKQLFQGAHYHIGELISVMDSENRNATSRHAIIKSSSYTNGLTTIELDRAISLTNANYTVQYSSFTPDLSGTLSINTNLGTGVIILSTPVNYPMVGMILTKISGVANFGPEATVTAVTNSTTLQIKCTSVAVVATSDFTTDLQNKLLVAAGSIVFNGRITTTKAINQSNGVFSNITLSEAPIAYKGSTLIFSTTALAPLVVKVIKIDKDDSNIYTISGLTHHEDKYTYIEQTGTIVNQSTTGNYTNFDSLTIPPVSNIQVKQVHVSNGVIEFSKLAVSWDWSSGEFISLMKPTFEVSYRRDRQDFTYIKDLATTNFDIDSPLPGFYEIYVWAVNFAGMKSIVTSVISPYKTSDAASTLLPPTNVYVPNTVGVVFNQRDLNLIWDFDSVNDSNPLIVDKLSDYIVQVLTLDGVSKQTYTIKPNIYRGGSFNFSLTENIALFGTPTRSFRVKIQSRDLVGDLSQAIEVVPNNPVPTITSVAVDSSFNSVYVKVTTPDEPDFLSFTYKKYTTQNSPTAIESIVTSTNYLDFKSTAGTQYYFSVIPTDHYGNGVESTRYSATSIGLDSDTYTYTGLVFKPNDPSINKVSWQSFTATKNGTTAVTIVAGNATWASGILYLYYIPGNTTLQSSTSLSAAITAGGRVLGTYKGGTDMTADAGKAFISGDQILAGTVGANNLITNTAVITNMAQIGNILQSSNYSSSGAYAGWRLDTTGTIYATGINITNADGQTVFASGSGFNWNNVNGTGIPQVGATRNVFLGSWSSSGYNYVVGDIVLDTAGYGWSCILAHTSSLTITTPVYPISTNTYWQLYTVKGSPGSSGLTTATVYIYKRLAGVNPPARPTLETEYTFNSAVLTGLDNGWSYILPSGTDPLYISAATASGNGSTDKIQASEWAAPVLLAKNGDDGLPSTIPGRDGVSTAPIFLYQATSTATPVPSPPSVNLIYTFSTGSLVDANGAAPVRWSRTMPTSGNYKWITTATALNANLTDTIDFSEWAPTALLAQSGVNGTRTAIMDMYKWDSSTPTVFPVGSSTYNWNTGQFSSPVSAGVSGANGWSLTPQAPTKGQTLYVARTIYADVGTSSTTPITWTATSATAQGYAGIDGVTTTNNVVTTNNVTTTLPGLRTAFIEMYKWSVSTPTSFPTGTSSYKWSDGTFTLPSTPAEWGLSPGTVIKGGTLYAISAYYTDTASTPNSNITWSSTKPYPVGYAGLDSVAGIGVLVSNETHTFPASSTGAITAVSGYTNSGTNIYVYEGGTQLNYTGTAASITTLANGTWGILTPVAATNITVGSITDAGTYASVAQHSGVAADTDTSIITYTIFGTTSAGVTFSFNKAQTFTKSKSASASGVGMSLSVITDRPAIFTALDGTLEAGQSNIVFTASTSGVAANPTIVWTFSGFTTAPTSSGATTQTITATQFGTSKGAMVTCTVNGVLTDNVSIIRVEKSTAAAGATVGAAFGVNITGQILSSNVSTFIGPSAIQSAQIGSIALTGTSNFSLKSGDTTVFNRIELDGQSLRVYSANAGNTASVLRVKLGNLA